MDVSVGITNPKNTDELAGNQIAGESSRALQISVSVNFLNDLSVPNASRRNLKTFATELRNRDTYELLVLSSVS